MLRTNIQAIALCLRAFVAKKTLCSFVMSFEPFVVKLFSLGFRFIAKLSVLRLEGAPSRILCVKIWTYPFANERSLCAHFPFSLFVLEQNCFMLRDS
jgi:hypothetical protein